MINGLNDAVDLLTASNNLHYQLWNFYIAVAIGLLGFRFSETYKRIPLAGRVVLILGFLAFAASNLNAIAINVAKYNAILTALAQLDSSDNFLVTSKLFAKMPLRDIWQIGPFHVAMSVFVALLLGITEAKFFRPGQPSAGDSK